MTHEKWSWCEYQIIKSEDMEQGSSEVVVSGPCLKQTGFISGH